MWSHGRVKQDKSRNRRKIQWDSTSIPLVDWLHQPSHQCKRRNYEPGIWEGKIEEWSKL